MLLELGIRNFAIIDEMRIAFEPGMTAVTGETGAGKSIIIDALGAVLGDRIGTDVIRTGAPGALVEAVFALDDNMSAVLAVLDEHGIEHLDGTLILSRQIAASGRSTARANGTTLTIAQLNQIGSLLIDIHGQSDHLKLLRPGDQMNALDRFSGVMELRDQTRTLVREREQLRRRRDEIRRGSREREQRADLLRYQLDEIGDAGLLPGEDAQVERDRAVLVNAERLVTEASIALVELESDDGSGAAISLAQVQAAIQHIAEIDSEAENLRERATELTLMATELASDIRRYRESIDLDTSRLALLDDRLDLIRNLKRKYGSSLEEIEQFAAQTAAELESLTDGEGSDEALAAQESELTGQIVPLSSELTNGRIVGARLLESRIGELTRDLGLGAAQVLISLEPEPDVTEHGAEHISFLFSPNLGETPKPLSRIASGGETARLMLALKSVLAEEDQTPTLVFDEVDVGVGARSGQLVGEKLWSLAGHHQVIVISHLAQIAAFAENHYMIQKSTTHGRTESAVLPLAGNRRRDELAEMIDGKPVSPESRAAADQLLDRINGIKHAVASAKSA